MGVLAPLVTQAQPALYGGGCNAPATAGATWRWTFNVTNPDGTATNLVGITGVCKIISAIGGAVLVTPTVTGALGSFTVEVDESLTGALATTETVRARWYLTLADGTDLLYAWASSHSNFVIEPGV